MAFKNKPKREKKKKPVAKDNTLQSQLMKEFPQLKNKPSKIKEEDDFKTEEEIRKLNLEIWGPGKF